MKNQHVIVEKVFKCSDAGDFTYKKPIELWGGVFMAQGMPLRHDGTKAARRFF